MPEVRKRRSVLSHPFRQRPRKGWGTQIWWWVNGWATTASYTLASNQVSGWSMNNGLALGYDAAGNVTSDGINAYQYDAEGRLCAVDTTKNVNSANPGYIGYIYDAAGTRVARGKLSSLSCNFATNGFKATTSWALGMGGEQVTEYAISGSAGSYASTWAHTNAFASGSLLATYHDADTYFALNDWLGNKRVEISAGGLSSTYRSLPFGNGLTSTGGATDATEHHFTGKERDAESGNDYFGARYYASSMGRWLSPDWSAKEEPVPYAKLDNPQSLNLYAYLLNNPLRGVDPDGHEGPDDPEYDAKIAKQAGNQNGSEHWDISNNNMSNGQMFWNGSNKCNEFVYDQVVDAGGPKPVVADTGRIPTAAQITDPKVKIDGFSEPRPLSEAKPGDMIAQDHGRNAAGTGDDAHAGIVVAPGKTASANANEGGKVTVNDWGFRSPTAAQNNGERNGAASPPPVVRHPLPPPYQGPPKP